MARLVAGSKRWSWLTSTATSMTSPTRRPARGREPGHHRGPVLVDLALQCLDGGVVDHGGLRPPSSVTAARALTHMWSITSAPSASGGARLPPSRELAAQLGVSRRLVTDAYAQLIAEGYLIGRGGSGTRVADGRAIRPSPLTEPAPGRLPPVRYDLHPGQPNLALFPRRDWLAAQREAMATLPDSQLGYEDPAGVWELRGAVADHLGRVRGALATPRRTLIVTGFGQGLRICADALRAAGVTRVAVEDPGFPVAVWLLRQAGIEPVPLPVDGQGLQLEALAAADVGAVLVCPAHSQPTGVVLAPERRAALLAWAQESDALVLEDDYDAEFRYDREPVGALQGLAPERVVLLGTVSKTLAPALRLGWLCVPDAWLERLVIAKTAADLGTPALEQHALAALLRSGAYERHLRRARSVYRRTREALLRALATELPEARVTGAAAGLHAVLRLPDGTDEAAVERAAAERSIRVVGLRHSYIGERSEPPRPALVLGYASLSPGEARIVARLLAECVNAE